jgi:transposase
MKPIDWRAWLAECKERGLSEHQIATMLGCGRNSVTRWKRYPAPQYIGLAVSALEAQLKAWKRS